MNKTYLVKDSEGNPLRYVNVPEDSAEDQIQEGETIEEYVQEGNPVSPGATPQ